MLEKNYKNFFFLFFKSFEWFYLLPTTTRDIKFLKDRKYWKIRKKKFYQFMFNLAI